MARQTVAPEAEQAVLGSFLIDWEGSVDRVPDLDPQWFASPPHQCIAMVVAAMIKARRPVDPILVTQELAARGWLDERVPSDMPMELCRGLGSSAAVEEYVRVLREAHALREARKVAADFLNDDGASSLDELLQKTAAKIGSIDSGKAHKVYSLQDAMIEMADELEAESRRKPGTELCSTGFPLIDRVTGGFEMGLPHLYAALPGVGKSALAIAMLSALGQRGEPTGVFWMEDVRRKLALRVAARHGATSALRMRHGSLMLAKDWERLLVTQEEIKNWPIYIDDSNGVSARQLAAGMRRMHRVYGCKTFLLDHLGELVVDLAEFNGRKDEALGEGLRIVRDTMADLGARGAVFHQLNQKAEGNSPPSLSWLFNSNVLGQVARVVGFLSSDPPCAVKVHFTKVTYGPKGVEVILGWDPETMSIFQPVETQR
jgi:replicative DNA helicase